MANKNIVKPKSGIGGDIVSGATRAAVQYITLTYVIPIAAPLVTGALGLIAGVPLFEISIGMGAMFAFTGVGLVFFDEWIQKRRVEDKLVFEQALVGTNAASPKEIIVGFRVSNRAAFPVEFEVVKISTGIETAHPQKRTIDGPKSFVVPAHGQGWFRDNPIAPPQPTPAPGTLNGFLEFQLRYGRPGALKYEMLATKNLILEFDKKGAFLNGTWIDASS